MNAGASGSRSFRSGKAATNPRMKSRSVAVPCPLDTILSRSWETQYAAWAWSSARRTLCEASVAVSLAKPLAPHNYPLVAATAQRAVAAVINRSALRVTSVDLFECRRCVGHREVAHRPGPVVGAWFE